MHPIYQLIQLINSNRISCLLNCCSQLRIDHLLRKVILKIVLHLISNCLNRIKIWQIWWSRNHWHVASFDLHLGFLSLVTWHIILYELKIRMLLKPIIKHRNNVLNIDYLLNMTPILLPEYTRSFCCSIKTSPKHPTCTTSAFSHYGSWIQFLTLSNTDPYSPMYFL